MKVIEICIMLLQRQDCFICKQSGHRARDCPEKLTSTPKSIAICLKCGNSGHDMFGCRNDYSMEDLEVVLFFHWKNWNFLGEFAKKVVTCIVSEFA